MAWLSRVFGCIDNKNSHISAEDAFTLVSVSLPLWIGIYPRKILD
jgi:hypothetical protein